MQRSTPVSLKPLNTFANASAALKNLDELSARLSAALKRLPAPADALLDEPHSDLHVSGLIAELDDYWRSTEDGQSRYDQFLTGMQEALRDEFSVKLHEFELGPHHAACLPADLRDLQEATSPAASAFSLHLILDDGLQAELAGALVFSQDNGITLLTLPGLGTKGFNTQAEMGQALADWLNSPTLRHALLNSLEQSHRDRLDKVQASPDLYLEPFIAADIQLQPISGSPFVHALERLLEKQRLDVIHACTRPDIEDRHERGAFIQAAIDQRGLLGPTAMLELRELALRETSHHRSLPDWVKLASPKDLKTYTEHLHHCELARAAVLSALGPAASPERFALMHLQRRLADDLGYALDPGQISISTRRTLPVTGQTYTLTRSWVELALYGLHPGDSEQGSDFLIHSVIHLQGLPLTAAYKALDAAYLARVIAELDVRVHFGEFQQASFEQPQYRSLMQTLTRAQITALALAARMQGHLSPDDVAMVDALSRPADKPASAYSVQRITLDGSHVMGKLLVFRKQDAAGQLERLVLFVQDAPDQQYFRAFDNPTQLSHELVSWAASDDKQHYLLGQVEVRARPALEKTLAALRLKPHPDAQFVQLNDLPDYDAGLALFAAGHVAVALSEQARHTPHWYVSASLEQRQELIALEDAAAAAIADYQSRSHTRVQPFEEYVFERASQQVNALLELPAGTVDPDLIVITSERETMTYTDMLLNGYDDGIDPLHATADMTATFTGPAGVDLSALTPMKVAGSVRGKWLADDYIAMVRSTLLNTGDEGYDDRRLASVQITQLQMKAAALRSHLKGHIDAVHYAWLKNTLDRAHLTDSETRKQYPFYPLQLHIDKPFIASGIAGVDQLVIPSGALSHMETVEGCFAVLPTHVRQTALLYTPQAPDGIEFRLFSDFVPSLGNEGMIDYYKDRCRIKARRTLSFFLRDMQQGGATKAPYLPDTFIGDFAHACFNRPIERRLRDTEETTTGRNDMLSKMIWTGAELVASALTLPFPPASFAVGALLALHDTARALEALTEGDHEMAGAYVLSALFNSAGAAGDLHSGLKGFGSIVHRLERRPVSLPALRPLSRHSSLPRYEDLFPVSLNDEPALLGKANVHGHAPVYRQLDHFLPQVSATGQFAKRAPDGAWQPLGSTPGNASGVPEKLAIDLSLQDVPRIRNGHAQGVCLVEGKYCIALNGKTYVVQFDAHLRCWQIIDPNNPFAFFGKQPVGLDAKGKWQTIERHPLRGGGLGDQGTHKPVPDEPGAPGAVTHLSDYEMPPSMRPPLYNVIDRTIPDPTGMGLELYFESHYTALREVFTGLREKLYRDADAYFKALVLPPRTAMPQLAPRSEMTALVEHVFTHSKGLVMSEAAQSVASKRLLIQNMPLLAEQRVEVLYVEHLFTDKHLDKLATYRRLATKSRSGSHEIKGHLKRLNDGALINDASEYDYYHLIKAAHRHGIEVRPFSSSISYPLLGHAVEAAVDDTGAAQKMSNFFGSTLISADVASNPSRRWVALLDQKLANTHNGIPGIAELQGAASVHIQDIPAGQATRIYNRNVISPIAGSHADFVVEFSNPLIIVPKPALPPSTQLDEVLMNRMLDRQSMAAGERWAGEYSFRWDDDNGWLRTEQESAIGVQPQTAIQQSLADAFYDTPVENRSTLHRLANFEHKGLDDRYFFSAPQLMEIREEFFLLRKRLQQDSQAVISTVPPARPHLPNLPPKTSPVDLFENLYQHTDGIVVGESHSSVASKKLIIDNLPALKQLKVKTLYMEHLLTDLHQADLDRFFETGQMSKNLLHDLQALDRGHHTDPDQVYNFERLVIRAREHGVEIRAIDCLASYHLKGITNEVTTTRQQMMNHFASRTLRKHQEVMGSHKWIALVGNSHSNTFMDTVPGLAELEGGIGLRVIDVMPGQSRGVVRDPGDALPLDLGRTKVHIQGDYRIDVEVPRPAGIQLIPRPVPVEKQLVKPGMFLVEQTEDGSQTIVHRSRDNQINRTPVNTDARARLFVDRPSWSSVHLKPYENMSALLAAFRKMGMTHVG